MGRRRSAYHFLEGLSRAERRRRLVALAFGSLRGVAREYGVKPSTVHQIVHEDRTSRPLSAFIATRIRQRLPREMADLWADGK